MATKKSRIIKAGDIFAVPLDDHMIAAGIVLHVSRYFDNSILVGYFDRRYGSIEEISAGELPARFAFTPNYTGKQMLVSGEWPVIGNRKALIEEAMIPKLVVVADVFYTRLYPNQVE